VRIAHVITGMIVGGAQENTLPCRLDLMREHGDDVLLAAGPSGGPGGCLLERGREQGVPPAIRPCAAASVRQAGGGSRSSSAAAARRPAFENCASAF
jgi:hypothetical protein